MCTFLCIFRYLCSLFLLMCFLLIVLLMHFIFMYVMREREKVCVHWERYFKSKQHFRVLIQSSSAKYQFNAYRYVPIHVHCTPIIRNGMIIWLHLNKIQLLQMFETKRKQNLTARSIAFYYNIKSKHNRKIQVDSVVRVVRIKLYFNCSNAHLCSFSIEFSILFLLLLSCVLIVIVSDVLMCACVCVFFLSANLSFVCEVNGFQFIFFFILFISFSFSPFIEWTLISIGPYICVI